MNAKITKRTPASGVPAAVSGSPVKPALSPAAQVAHALTRELGLEKPEVTEGWAEIYSSPELVKPAMAAFQDASKKRSPLERTHLFDFILHSYNDALAQTLEDGKTLQVSLEQFRQFVSAHPEHASLVRLFTSEPLASSL